MSLRLEMLQVARLAPKVLGYSSSLVIEFFQKHLNPDGGFADRAGQTDLYYTVFGLEGLLVLRVDPPEKIQRYLESFVDPGKLDFVHLCCLARGRASWQSFSASAPTN